MLLCSAIVHLLPYGYKSFIKSNKHYHKNREIFPWPYFGALVSFSLGVYFDQVIMSNPQNSSKSEISSEEFLEMKKFELSAIVSSATETMGDMSKDTEKVLSEIEGDLSSGIKKREKSESKKPHSGNGLVKREVNTAGEDLDSSVLSMLSRKDIVRFKRLQKQPDVY